MNEGGTHYEGMLQGLGGGVDQADALGRCDGRKFCMIANGRASLERGEREDVVWYCIHGEFALRVSFSVAYLIGYTPGCISDESNLNVTSTREPILICFSL